MPRCLPAIHLLAILGFKGQLLLAILNLGFLAAASGGNQVGDPMENASGGLAGASDGQDESVSERPPPEMPGLFGAPAAVVAASPGTPPAASSDGSGTPQSAAAQRIGKRYNEMLESEFGMVQDLQQLIAALTVLSQDKAWKLRDEHVQLIHRTSSTVNDLVRVHSTMREMMQMFAGSPAGLAQVFLGSQDDLVTVHGEFQTLSTCVMVVLQKKAGGQVIGDRAVGTTLKAEGSLAAALAPIQDLLVRPSQRVMKYGLFLEEMAADAARSEQPELELTLRDTARQVTDYTYRSSYIDHTYVTHTHTLRDTARQVKEIVTNINERIRGIQRRERVQMIAARVRAIPADVRLVEHGREFVIDDGNFRERGRAGY